MHELVSTTTSVFIFKLARVDFSLVRTGVEYVMEDRLTKPKILTQEVGAEEISFPVSVRVRVREILTLPYTEDNFAKYPANIVLAPHRTASITATYSCRRMRQVR